MNNYMKVDFLERIFGSVFFVILNIVIILAVETTGSFFFETGILHAIALFFVLLAFVRIFVNYKTYDQFLDKIKHASVFALFVFAVSHLVEYVNMMVLHRYNDAVFAGVVHFYLIGIVIMTIGAELFLVKYEHRSNLFLKFAYLSILILAFFNMLFMFRPELVSLEMDTFFPYLYAFLVISAFVVFLKKVLKLKNKISISKQFLNYLSCSVVLICIATVPNIFYEFLEEDLHLPFFQMVYFSHFAFFIALSLMFLSYKKLAALPGLYAEAGKAG